MPATFHVYELEQESGKTIVRGRICEGILRVGHVFRSTKPYVASYTKDNERHSLWGQERRIELMVISLLAYRRSWNELDAGMSAQLELGGQGADLLEYGCILLTEASPLTDAELESD